MKIITRRQIINFFLVVSIFILTECKSKSSREFNPTIFTGQRVEITEEKVSSSGGEIFIDKPGDPLDGLTIDVPENAYSESRTFQISYEPITNHELGKYFNPLTPLISISNGGGYSEEAMTLTIPVNVPEGHFAMAFLYNSINGKLEGMPLIASDNNKVVVVTRRFGDPSGTIAHKSSFKGLSAQADPVGDEEIEKIVVTAAKEGDLRGNHNTKFHPRVDDFPTTNYGSTIARGGHCAGQSLAMMWYFTQRKSKGAEPLYTLLDNDGNRPTPKFWQDDVLAIKLASRVQNEFTIGLPVRAVVLGLEVLGQITLPDRITLNAFSYAILLTKEPQLVVINQSFSTGAGHAMVVYEIRDLEMHIADPNYPGDKTRRIIFDEYTKSFRPYNSGANASSLGTQFSIILYAAKSSFFSWPTIAGHWEEVENKTIGNEKFPEFSLVALNEDVEFVPFSDGFNVPEGRLTVNARTPGVTNNTVVYDANGKLLVPEGSSVQLKPGEQLVGINALDMKGTWVGFKWVKVKVAGDVVREEEKPTNGTVFMNLELDGVPVTIDTTKFGTSDLDVNIRGYTLKPRPTGEDYERSHIWISAGGITALGEQSNPGAEWRDNNDGSLYKSPPNSGSLRITQWAPGKFEGTFSFTLIEQNVIGREPRTKKVEGDFRYQGPRY